MDSKQKQEELIKAKRAEVLAKLAKFNKPQPAPSAPSSGLNVAELKRRIDETKSKLSGSLFPVRHSETKPPALSFKNTGEIDLMAMMNSGLIPQRETSTKISRSKKVPAAAEQKPLKKTDNVSSSELTDPSKNPYFDASMSAKVTPRDRRTRQLKFNKPGKYVDIANQERAKAQFEKLKQDITESVKKAGMQTEFDASDKAIKREVPPAAEWWDVPFLPNKTYADVDDMVLDPENLPKNYDTLVTCYIHHPVPIPPPWEANAPPVVKSLMLTTKERKKMRRQRRAEELKDKRDKIRLGLLEPDAPKVKISNLMKVLGDEAIQDPTKVEAKVRREMELRQKLHDKANAQRKLTKEERREKIMNKMKDDQKTSNEVAVFKIKSCSHPKHRYKIEKNAEQHGLTGIVIVQPRCNLVVVEGGPKAIKAYKKLMLRRIDWNDMPPPKSAQATDGAPKSAQEDNMEIDQTSFFGLSEGEENKCFLVWSGPVKTKSFKKFTWRTFESEKMAREELGKWNVENYWDIAISSSDGDLAARQPQL